MEREKLKFQREKLIEEKRLNYEKVLEAIIRTFAGAKIKKNWIELSNKFSLLIIKKQRSNLCYLVLMMW